MVETIKFEPIGIIHSPFVESAGMPIQPAGAGGIKGRVELKGEYAECLADLEGFSHIILLYYFHKAKSYLPKVKPFLDDTARGVFATRAPNRPNSIGLSIVRLEKIDGTTLYISNLDILDGTPLLDIKPYVPDFESKENIRIGWLSGKSKQVNNKKSDTRMSQ